MRQVLVLVILTAFVIVPTSSAASEPTRILIVGDSVAHGSSGDWTWRYRLWKALAGSGASVDLVGPNDELHNLTSDPAGALAYADGDFDRDHAARWGMALVDPDATMTSLVETFRPDVVIETRGINDLIWFGRSPGQVVDDVAHEIDEARAVEPEVDFVVAGLPQVWFGGATEYNAMLPGLATDLGEPGSRVVVAGTGVGFSEGVDTWDPAHLSATGEIRFAAAVADALVALGVGTPYPRPWPDVDNGHWGIAHDVVATAQERAARLDWVAPPGGLEQYVWVRDVSENAAWVRLPYPVRGEAWTVDGLAAAHTYEFRLQSAKGTAISADFSAVAQVTPLQPLTAAPGAVTGLSVHSAPEQLGLSWDPVPGATSYDVAWAVDGGSSGLLSVTAPHAVLTGLVPGLEYRLTVAARNGGGTGAPAIATGRPMPRVSPPATPRGLRVQPGRHRLRVTWDAGSADTSYDLGVVGETSGYLGRRLVADAPVVYRRLLAGERYTIYVTPRNGAGAGPMAQATGTPTGPHVTGPARLRARALDGGRVRLTWRERRHATAYEVAARRGGSWVSVRTTARPRATVPFGAGPARSRWRVRSWHQRQPGGWSEPVRLSLTRSASPQHDR